MRRFGHTGEKNARCAKNAPKAIAILVGHLLEYPCRRQRQQNSNPQISAMRMPLKLPFSPVPATDSAPARMLSAKRVHRLRLNWFVVGSVFGVGISFFVSFLAATLVIPHYQEMRQQRERVANAAPVQSSLALAPLAIDTPLTTPPRTNARVIADRTLARHETIGGSSAAKELAIAVPANASPSVDVEKKRLAALEKPKALEKTYRGFGVIKTSLLQGGASAGIPSAAMQEIIRAFSHNVDFQRDIHPGDTIEVLIDRNPAKPGKGKIKEKTGSTLRYAALTLGGKKHEIFRFDGAWYDASGKSIKKSLLATPVSVAQITSGFGMREHPVLGYNRFHRGVDFGASQGTPILAAGDGVVTFKGWKGGYGNFVTIRHNNTYETAYGHISRFGKIQVGSRVKQGQPIAYVGMTGTATGPHLHYEVRMNGEQVNPTARQFNLASGLGGKQLAQFKNAKSRTLTELASLAKPRQLASR